MGVVIYDRVWPVFTIYSLKGLLGSEQDVSAKIEGKSLLFKGTEIMRI